MALPFRNKFLIIATSPVQHVPNNSRGRLETIWRQWDGKVVTGSCKHMRAIRREDSAIHETSMASQGLHALTISGRDMSQHDYIHLGAHQIACPWRLVPPIKNPPRSSPLCN